MRRYFCKVLFYFLIVSISAAGRPAGAETISITILHTNDTHSRLLPFSYPASARGTGVSGLKTRLNIGGIARRATLIKSIRAELEQKGTTVLVMDAGDFSDGTHFSIEYQGEADAEAMNAAGYTLATPGNHEFNYSRAQLHKLISVFKFPIISANIADSKTGAPLTEEYKIIQAGPVKVGVFGLITGSTSGYPAAREGIKITGELTAARRMVKTLAGRADIVILLSHCGEEKDREIAAKVPGIAAIVGGHSHSRLPLGEMVWNAQSGRALRNEGTILVQAHQWGGELGRLDMELEKDAAGAWSVVRHKASLIPVTSDIAEDRETASVVERYWKPIAAKYTQVVGRAAADFTDRGNDLPAYNLMADALRETYKTDFALENMGGTRAPLLAGDITAADLAAMDPFDNTVITFSITGRRLRNILQSQRPAVSGIKYMIEKNAVTLAIIGDRPLEDNKTYTGATNSYFARIVLKGIKSEDTGRQRLDVLAGYIRHKVTVSPVYDSRRVIK
jgi:5'-nucleotidase